MAMEPVDRGSRRYLQIGKYQVVAHLATGGMGAVYRARDTDLGREVALKVLSPEFAANPVRLERFRREARHSARLQHENIVTIYEFGESNGIHFLALEFVDGLDLYEYVAEKGQLDAEEARLILIQAVRALKHAHGLGIVHRDIKPSNLLLTHKDDRLLAKLTDFGVACEAREEDARVTGAGLTVGTIDYMPPEQARDSRLADIRSDIYSLGCTLFHMLTGRPPFEGSVIERVFKHAEEELPNVLQFNPRVPPYLDVILRHMTAKKPADRYQTPDEVLNDLLHPKAVRRPHPPRAAAPEPEPSTTEVRRPRSKGSGRTPPEPARREDSDTSPLLAISAEQRRAAEGQFGRAREALEADNDEYAIELLHSCCKLDPGNLLYRRLLRQTERANRSSGRLGWLTSLGSKTKLKSARRSGDFRKVLEHGEEVLARNPHDTGTHLEMAEAAKALRLPRLQVWLMEQAQQSDPANVALSRGLARLYEHQGDFNEAIAQWERVRKADPNDGEAFRKVRDLAASDTIARGNYSQQLEGAKPT